MINGISLDNLNDKQKILLSQISYVEINELGREKIANGGLTISELKSYLEISDKSVTGMSGKDGNNLLISSTFGENKIPTHAKLIDEMIANGLGNLRITDVSKVQSITSSGFQALTFSDTYGNVGISYRGSDFDFSKGGARDWLESDMLEYFLNDSTQRKEALAYFNDNKSQYGNNYVYGHSLGGNLTSHVFVENYNEIKEAFTINGNPINQKLINTPEKVAAFNDPNKYNCNIICGDIVGHYKSCEVYEDNVNYIQNSDTMKPSAISAHMVQSASYDENGNFKKATKEEMIDKMGIVTNYFMDFVKNVRESLNELEDKINEKTSNIKMKVDEYKKDLNKSFSKKTEELNYNTEIIYDEQLKEEFQNASKEAEREVITMLQNYVSSYKQNNQIKNDEYNNLDQKENYVR